MPGRRPAVLATLLGIAAGVTVSVLIVGGGTDPTTTAEATTAPPTSTPAWAGRRETRLGPTTLLPEALEIQGEQVLLVYSLADLAPAGGTDRPPVQDGALAAPASFTMIWSGGEVSARVTGPANRAVRFTAPSGFTLDQITGIRVDSFWVAAPARFPIELSASSGAWVEVTPGLRARILHVAEQSTGNLVTVEVGGSEALSSSLSVAGEERVWLGSSSSLLGDPTWTLTYRGSQVPDPVRLLAVGVAWVEVPGGGIVQLEGLSG